MTLGATQQSAHRVLHGRGDVRPSAAFTLVMRVTMMLMMMLLLLLLLVVLMRVTVLAHRLVVVHHLLQPRRRRRGCHFVATRLHHVHRVVHVRSNPAGFLAAVRPLNQDDDSLQTHYPSLSPRSGDGTSPFREEASPILARRENSPSLALRWQFFEQSLAS
jgi:hypothetical protein